MPKFVSSNSKKICIICEGYEEYDYIVSLKNLNVWNKVYSIVPKNAKSIDNISAIYQNEYSNDNFDLVLIFCDTEMPPYNKFISLKEKLKKIFGSHKAVQSIIFFANPCTMQIILSHFGLQKLMSNEKNYNSGIIKDLTGVKDYRGAELQRQSLMKKINSMNYIKLKENLKYLGSNEDEPGSTNFLQLLENLESNNTGWIQKIIKKLES
jgi:hypothetical protein